MGANFEDVVENALFKYSLMADGVAMSLTCRNQSYDAKSVEVAQKGGTLVIRGSSLFIKLVTLVVKIVDMTYSSFSNKSYLFSVICFNEHIEGTDICS